jgi:hypothetical protein
MLHQSRARATWSQRVLATLGVLNTVAALAGAWGLASGVLSLGPTLTSRLPFGSAVIGGVALGLLVALPNGVLAAVALRGGRHVGLWGIAVGSGLVIWILVELAFIRDLSFLHPLYASVGLIMVWAGARSEGAQHGT